MSPATSKLQRSGPCAHADVAYPQAFVYQILKALSFAHSNRVMHRDLKPQNILVDRANQQLKIADFGLARAYLPPYRAYTEKVWVSALLNSLMAIVRQAPCGECLHACPVLVLE